MSLRASLESSVMQIWQRRSWRACLLLPLAWLYGALLLMRRLLYGLGWLRITQLPVPVIVVGNIFVGGTGKTPMVIWLVEQLRQRGWRPGVIARGYRADLDQVAQVLASSDASVVGDEPLLIKQRTDAPVWVGRSRVASAAQMLHEHPEVDVVISDDGLQHYALARTIEIQLSDARGHGNGWLLPAGPLREPASRRADFFVVNRAAPSAQPAALAVPTGSEVSAAPEVPAVSAEPFRSVYQMRLHAEFAEQFVQRSQRQALSSLPHNRRIIAAAGIGHPQRFFDMLNSYGVVLADTIALPDHYDYRSNPFRHVRADMILITEKDAVKCGGTHELASDARLWVVPVVVAIDQPLLDNIVEKLRGPSTA